MDFLNILSGVPEKKEEKKVFADLKKGNDKEVFIQAYDLLIDDIYRFVYFKIGNKEDAQDLTSQVFLKAWNYLQNNSIDEEKSLRALIYKISRTTIIDHYRKQSHVKIVSLDNSEKSIDVPDEATDLKRDAEVDSDMSAMEINLKKLKDEYREVIIFKYIDQLSITEISNILGKSKGSVRVLLHRAVNALKDISNTD